MPSGIQHASQKDVCICKFHGCLSSFNFLHFHEEIGNYKSLPTTFKFCKKSLKLLALRNNHKSECNGTGLKPCAYQCWIFLSIASGEPLQNVSAG